MPVRSEGRPSGGTLDRRVGRDALADGEGVRQPRGHSERSEAPKARHIDEIAVAYEVAAKVASVRTCRASFSLDVPFREMHSNITEERLGPAQINLPVLWIEELVSRSRRLVCPRRHEVEDALQMSGRPRPEALGRVGVSQRRADARFERAEVALGDRVFVRRIGHCPGVLLDEVLRDRLDLRSVETSLVVGVPTFDEASLKPMLESAPNVFHRRGNLGRRAVDEEREEELRAITVKEVHHRSEAVRPRAWHLRTDVGVDAMAEVVISAC